jgi:hypothetical protein
MFNKLLILLSGAILAAFFSCGGDDPALITNNDTTTGHPNLKIPAAYLDTAPGYSEISPAGFPRYSDTCCLGNKASGIVNAGVMKQLKVYSNACNNLQLRYLLNDSLAVIDIYQATNGVFQEFIYYYAANPAVIGVAETTYINPFPDSLQLVNGCFIIVPKTTRVRVKNEVCNVAVSGSSDTIIGIDFYGVMVGGVFFDSVKANTVTPYEEIIISGIIDVLVEIDSAVVHVQTHVLSQVTIVDLSFRNVADFITEIREHEDNTVIIDTSIVSSDVLAKKEIFLWKKL